MTRLTRCLDQPKNLSNSSNSSFYDGVFSPHQIVAIPGPWSRFFFRNAHLQRRFDGRDERQNLIHGALVFWLDPKLASPPSEDPKVGVHVASLHRFHINYESPKESKFFLVKMPTEYCLIVFHWHSASWSLCFGCICV